MYICVCVCKKNYKAIPGQSWTDLEGSRRLALKGGELSALLTGCLYPLGNIPGAYFCWRLR